MFHNATCLCHCLALPYLGNYFKPVQPVSNADFLLKMCGAQTEVTHVMSLESFLSDLTKLFQSHEKRHTSYDCQAEWIAPLKHSNVSHASPRNLKRNLASHCCSLISVFLVLLGVHVTPGHQRQVKWSTYPVEVVEKEDCVVQFVLSVHLAAVSVPTCVWVSESSVRRDSGRQGSQIEIELLNGWIKEKLL